MSNTGENQPVSARWLFCAAVHLLLGIWVFRECLTPEMIPFGRDTLGHDILFFQYGWAVTRALGEVPLWNHMLFAGWPWVAAAGWTPWYPPHWLALVMDADFAFSAQWALHHAIAGLGFTVWARAIGVRWPVALIGGVLFQMSAHFTTLVFPGHLAKFEAIAWSPWIMAFGLRAMRGERRALVWASVFLAMQVLTQHAQIVYDTAIALGLMALWMGIARSAPLKRTLAVTALVGIFGAMLAAVQLLPTTEMVRISNRAEGVAWEEAVETSHPPRELIEMVRPGLYGSNAYDTHGPYMGEWGERLVSDYLGAVTLVGLLLCLVFAARDRALRKRTAALLAFFVVTLLVAVGYHTPLYRVLYDWLPGWDRWRSPATIMFLTTFAAVTMAALGWGALLEKMPQKKRWVVAGLLIILGSADLYRVDAKHVGPAAAADSDNMTRVEIQMTLGNPEGRAWPLFGRGRRNFFPGREMSNIPMLSNMPSITGYHPIVLERYQRLFELLQYNNPQLHRLLGASLRSGTTLLESNGSEMLWVPREVKAATDVGVDLIRLRDSEGLPYETAPISNAIPATWESTLLGRSLKHQWFPGNTGSMGELWYRSVVRHLNNRTLIHIPLPSDEPRWVVISQIIAPGWKIIQPEGLEIHEAWGSLWAVKASGNTVIDAVYEPESVRLGLFVSLCAMAVALMLMIRKRDCDHGIH